MIQAADSSKQPKNDVGYERLLWRFLDKGSPRWAKVEVPDDTATESGAFTRLVLSGQIQLRLRVLARGLPSEPEIEATVVVTGDYTKILANEIRSAVPEFSGRVIVMPQLPAEYRLSRAGLETQKEIREFGGGEFEEGFLSASLQFAIPGVVSIQNLRYVDRAPTGEKQSNDAKMTTSPSGQKKSPRMAAWPVSKTEGHVAAYLAGKENLYRKLAQDALDEMPGAYEKFRKEFGSTAIAEAITWKVGTKTHRACSKQDIGKTRTYKSRIQPLMQNPPEKPDDWDELLEDRHGEGLPGILDEIPYEEDDS